MLLTVGASDRVKVYVCVRVGCAFEAKILLSAVFGFKGGGVVV